MDRRSFLKFLGIAPVVSVAGVAAVSAVPATVVGTSAIISAPVGLQGSMRPGDVARPSKAYILKWISDMAAELDRDIEELRGMIPPNLRALDSDG